MNKRKLEELIALAEERDIKEISISGLFRSVRIVRGSPQRAEQHAAPPPIMTAPPAGHAPESTEDTAAEADRDSGLVPIASPMVGTFYLASSPGAEPYVRQGDHVSRGQVVCIIEAMKLMNEIESEIGGTVVRVLVENAQPVEFGQKLFLIQPD